jgi:hypothetical protein
MNVPGLSSDDATGRVEPVMLDASPAVIMSCERIPRTVTSIF